MFRKRYLSFFSPREVSMKYSPTAPKNNYDMNGPSVGSCSSIFTSLPYLFTISGFFISIFIIFGHFRSVVRAVSTFSHILFCQMTHFVINCYHPLSFSGILKPSEPNKHKRKAQDFFIKKQNKTYIYIYIIIFSIMALQQSAGRSLGSCCVSGITLAFNLTKSLCLKRESSDRHRC